MARWMVTIRREEFSSDDFFVNANSIENAKNKALEEASNAEWGTGNVEYETDDESCMLVEPVKCSICKKDVDVEKVHLHQGEFIGEECDCWDDRLKANE